MPHECVDCGEVCEDGSSDVFEGCPSCGGTKFFYVREVSGSQEPPSPPSDASEAVSEESSDDGGMAESATPSTGQSTLEEIAEKPAADPSEDLTDAVEIEADAAEHTSQQRARAVTVGDDDLDGGGWPDDSADDAEERDDADDIVEADGEYERAFGGKIQPGGSDDDIVDADGAEAVDSEHDRDTITRDGKTYERVDGGEAKQELAAEFETIKIVEPGSYELNLMNLYDRDEKIIALEEDGRYQVSLPTFDE